MAPYEAILLGVILCVGLSSTWAASEETAREDAAREDAAREDAAREDVAHEDVAHEDVAHEDVAHEDVRRIVGAHTGVFAERPSCTPNDASVDGPLLGNGDLGVALGGEPCRQCYWIAKNDFWRLRSQYGESGPRPLGRLELEMPSLSQAAYHVEQHYLDAVTTAQFRTEEGGVTLRSWVAATDNVLVVELEALGSEQPVTVHASVMDGGGSRVDKGKDGGLWWGDRRFEQDVDIPTGAAVAVRLLGAADMDFVLRPGEPVRVVAGVKSRFESPDYRDEVAAHVASLGNAAVDALFEKHQTWWEGFWTQSWVELDDPVIERHYYRSQYVMASCSRNPNFPPPIFGTWITTDTPAWFGDYHLNYNHMAPYYGLYSSNHFEQADPYHAPLLAFLERGRYYAREAQGCRGIMLPVGIGPMGIETTRNATRHGEENQEAGGLFYGQKSNAAYAVVNLSMRWRHSYDPEYAERVYPFVREVALFWEDYLKLEAGRYVIRADAVHEGSGENLNSIVSLGLVRNVFETALDMSAHLEADAERHAKWQDILARLSGFATQEKDGKTIFRYTERGTAWWDDNTLGIQHIYPAGAIGLDSPAELLEVARDTITVMGRWLDFNGTNSFFPAAVHVGYDPDIILEKMRAYAEHTYPNGFQLGNPHGIENCSTVPSTIDEMLCMGHGHVIRVFPVWPRTHDARFSRLRTWGAFLVSSALQRGKVQYVALFSERGRDCTLLNPWPGRSAVLHREDGKTARLTGDRFHFATRPGEHLRLAPD